MKAGKTRGPDDPNPRGRDGVRAGRRGRRARGQTDLREAVRDVGVDLFLTKPFSPIELGRNVQELLARPRS
jgi:CheY-like chemotaxis protein